MTLRHGAGTLRNGVARLLAACLVGTLVAGCSSSAAERRGAARARDRQPTADDALPREAAPRIPIATSSPAPAAPFVVVDPLGLPVPPSGSVTSDRGGRLARPTPIGQIAPEEPPPETPLEK